MVSELKLGLRWLLLALAIGPVVLVALFAWPLNVGACGYDRCHSAPTTVRPTTTVKPTTTVRPITTVTTTTEAPTTTTEAPVTTTTCPYECESMGEDVLVTTLPHQSSSQPPSHQSGATIKFTG